MKKIFIVLLFFVFGGNVYAGEIYLTSTTTFVSSPSNPVLSGDGSGFDSVRIENPQVVLVDGVYHLYYGGTTGGNYIEIGSAISSDGANWTRVSQDPVLRCGENTDLACTTGGVWSNYRVVPETVLYEDGIYKMWYLGNNKNSQAINKLGYATSTDGISWNIYSQNPVFQPYSDRGGQFLGVVHVGDQYFMYYRHFDGATDTNLAISSDGINWTPYEQNPIVENMSVDSVHQVGERVFTFADGVLGETVDGFKFSFEQSQAINVDHPQVALSGDGSELFLWRNGGVSGLYFETAAMPATLTIHEEVDPLVLQYAPKLALHPDEDYVPMDVMDFVEASALWDMGGADSQLHDAVSLTPEVFENEIDVGGTSEYYLAFSDPDTKKSIDLAAAKAKYEALDSPTTVYYHKVDDGDFTILQYWYFYAMNNWKEHGGRNNHEGDWESVFVYLDKDTEEPAYVAYSAHHNDGDPTWDVLQYDSVRRGWDSSEIEKNDDTVTSFVALGSHANYPNAGDHNVFGQIDKTRDGGGKIVTADYLVGNAIAASTPFWMNYEGKWGTDQVDVKESGSGPQGPAFSDVSGHVRFLNPVEWAGIDKIQEMVANGSQREFVFQKAGVLMRFLRAPASGERMKVDPHDELISFGETPQGVTLLPKFWDITSSLTNGTFSADVSFTFDPETVAQLGGNLHTLGVYYYDEVQKQWERQRSVVDTEDETVSFTTNHLSRYALGFVDEAVYVGNLFDQLREVITESSLHRVMKRIFVHKVKLAERFALKDRRGTKIAVKRMLTYLDKAADRFERFGLLTEVEASEIDSLVQRLLMMIR